MKNRLLKWALALLIFAGLAAALREYPIHAPLQAQPTIWLSSYDEALKLARETGKPVLIDFQADWCGPCHMMRDAVFEPPSFQPEAARWVLLAVDVDKQPDLAQKYGANSLPMLLVLNSQGMPILLTKGYRNPQFTQEFLNAAHDKAVGKS